MADLRKMAKELIEGTIKKQAGFDQEVYNCLRKEHIEEDVLSILENNYGFEMPDKAMEDIASRVAERYVYGGAASNDVPYWDSIISIIESELLVFAVQPIAG